VPLLVLPFLAPAAFWLFSKLLFDDGFCWRRRFGWLLVGVAVVYYLAFCQRRLHLFPSSPTLDFVSGLTIHLISLIFVLLGILEAARNREADLVLSRLEFRTVFILATALLLAITLLTEVGLEGEPPPPLLDVVQKAAIALLTIVFTANCLNFKVDFLPEKEKAATPTPPTQPPTPEGETPLTTSRSFGTSSEMEMPPQPTVDERLLRQLTDFMDNQKIWRTEGLTIRLLAEKMNVKEYRLRQAINQHLGYRNFNDYLNGYRIREACAVLGDPEKRDLTILEIAYDLGYASLAPFNKAFKDLTGMTPTQWRKKNAD
ncbi:MAG: AraC family transcriptional regulator, partial [Bacteroidota bacterium]